MLFQLHWQHKDGSTEMKAQREVDSLDEIQVFVKETQEDHPLPDGVIWMACNEKSKHFVFGKSKSNKQINLTTGKRRVSKC